MASRYFEIRADQIDEIIQQIDSPVGNWCLEIEAGEQGEYSVDGGMTSPVIESARLVCVCEDGETRSIDVLKYLAQITPPDHCEMCGTHIASDIIDGKGTSLIPLVRSESEGWICLKCRETE